MNVHLIAIGGSAMHNLAIALKRKGFNVSGSDDEIFEPSRSRLQKEGILPDQMGWFEEKITNNLDAVIVGMHARKDNPELLRAHALGLKIFSYPEYIFEQTKDKIRIVVGGSHGKTSTTAMILHVLNACGIDCDYMVGAQLDGFDCMVKLTKSAKYAIIEGDEYLSSPIDLRPKFHLYQPHIAILTGIAWDHINVFPTFQDYLLQFQIFLTKIERNGTLIYCESDSELNALCTAFNSEINKIPYSTHPHTVEQGVTFLTTEAGKIPLRIFGAHNLQNLNAAKWACATIGLSNSDFYAAIQTFSGAAKRLEKVRESKHAVVYKDFAHSPSKLKATTEAFKNQYPNRKLVACMELHTFSSLNATFLAEYRNAMVAADHALVYFNPHTIEHKKLNPITAQQVLEAFGTPNVTVYTQSADLVAALKREDWHETNLLLMTSGNFDGLNFDLLAQELLPE